MLLHWREIFAPSVAPVELILRGSITYLFIFALLRIFKREAGAVSITDVLLIVLIADAAQNSMTGGYKSVTDGFILIFTLVFWSFFLNWLGAKVPWVERILHPPPEPLIAHGRLNFPLMKKLSITMDELMSQLRENGITDPSDVKIANIEGDGSISIVSYDEGTGSRKKKKGGAGT